MRAKFRTNLKSSQFMVEMVRAGRGLARDMHVLACLAQRQGKIARYMGSNQVKKLQLGTSNNILAGWLNTDIYPNHGPVVFMNATTHFPFDDNTFDYVMAEHMIEHIEYEAAQVMLRECYRVLKPGGRVRFATPDLGVLLALYTKEKTDAQRNYIDWLVARLMPEVQNSKDVFVINNSFRAWGHCFLYDRETLHRALEVQGFCEIKFHKPGESDDPSLKNLESHGREIGSEDINQFETLVVEGRKRE